MKIATVGRSSVGAGTVALVSALAIGCANVSGSGDLPAAPPADWAYERLEPQVYTPPGWPEALEATVYRPQRAGALPAVLVVHGGGWARRSPADMQRICRALASRGFVAVNVAYRLAPAYRYPAPLEDLQQALNWMQANAAELQIDAGRIGGFGYSAGAHLVSLLALLESSADPSWRPPGGAPRLQAVVAGGTPADLTRWPKSPLVNQFIGSSIQASPEVWAQASPVSHVTPASPPFFLYHGGFDRLVEVEQAQALKRSLDGVGVPTTLYTVPYHGHLSMFLLNRSAVRRASAFLSEALDASVPDG
ncbi:MAG: alpha/beta hydrolase [Pseudomonadales bacterium]